jgi:predicted nucleic acid-binding protein
VILVDTSIWIDHFRRGDERLATLLNQGQVLIHSYVIGELALGNMRLRRQLLRELQELPRARVATEQEVLFFIERLGLFGQGIGYVDAHLLAAARLTEGTTLWTRDRRLSNVSTRLGLAFDLSP